MAGRKIFISYKYADDCVEDLIGCSLLGSTVRDYVDLLEGYFDESDHIYKGESDGEDLSQLSEATIHEKLRNRIYDSSLTIVMISPGMVDPYKVEREQWIPWEVSFSLKETTRRSTTGQKYTSRTNAMLAIVLPDDSGSYEYYLEPRFCCTSPCTIHHTNILFDIIKRNQFNRKSCEQHVCAAGSTIWYGESSYIKAVRWSDFVSNPERYIEQAYRRRDDIDSYDICKTID